MKAPGSKHLKLEPDKLLSNFAFNSNLRRYNLAALNAISHALVALQVGPGYQT
jgi:hypothetical protein